jgi:hypothetical protein
LLLSLVACPGLAPANLSCAVDLGQALAFYAVERRTLPGFALPRNFSLSSISVRKGCIFSAGACLAIRYDGVSARCSVRLGLGHVATAGLCPSALVFSLVQETTPGSGVMFICRGLASFLVHSCVRCCQTCAGPRIGLVLAFLLFLLRARSSLLVPLSSLRFGVIPAVRLLTFHFYVACS